jgi:hypothetical protein
VVGPLFCFYSFLASCPTCPSDYNYVRNGDKCIPVGPEPIPAGVCTGGPGQTYRGSSGYRLIPGNTCQGGLKMDEPVEKPCSQGIASF